MGAARLLRESTDILLESVPRHVSMAEVHRRMLGVPGVAAVHDLHVWTVTSGMIAMSGHAVVPDLEAHPGVLDGIRSEMSLMGIGHVTIQLEVEHGCEGCDDARETATAPPWGHPRHHHHARTPPLRLPAVPSRTLLRHPTALSIYAPRRPGVRASAVLNPRWSQGHSVDP